MYIYIYILSISFIHYFNIIYFIFIYSLYFYIFTSLNRSEKPPEQPAQTTLLKSFPKSYHVAIGAPGDGERCSNLERHDMC